MRPSDPGRRRRAIGSPGWLLTALLLGGIATTAAAQDQKFMPREQTFHRVVQAGQELRVFTYANWHSDCSPEPPPRIVMRTPPAHGTVSLRPGLSHVAFVRVGQPDCTGHVYDGVGVWYVPQPGFRGADQFDWDVQGARTVSHDTAVVQVQ